jgi:hypothetical protein
MDKYEAPPLPGKSHPPGDMGFVVPSSDDARRVNLRDYTEFEVDPVAADAAADLAGELGVQFLEGAIDGEEATEHTSGEPGRASDPRQFLFDEQTDGMYEESMDEESIGVESVPAPRDPRPRRPGRG